MSRGAIIVGLAWPLVALYAIIVFRGDVRSLLKRLIEAKFPGGQALFSPYGKADIDKGSRLSWPHRKAKAERKEEEGVEEEASKIRWQNSGNLFWLPHDLRWTIDVLLRGAARDQIVHGLRQSLHHLRVLGLGVTSAGARLARLKADASNSLDQDWTFAKRNDIASELQSIILELGRLAEVNQPDFDPTPKEL